MNNTVRDIVTECAPYTMLTPERLVETVAFMVELAGSPRFPDGHIVECGTWKGGTALAAIRAFGVGRSYTFYDSFQGLPPPGPRDGEDAHWWIAHPEHPRYFENCCADVAEVQKLMDDAVPHVNVTLVEGWFEETLRPRALAPVAWAHLDCDWYDSTYLCLERLWPCMAQGGVLVIDDYYDWEGCRRAVHDFLSRHQAREAIERVGVHGGINIRKLGSWTVSESSHLQ
jgi:O-methyltransferase